MRRLQALGKPMRMKLYPSSKWKGQVSNGNVAIDLIGSEKPEKIILIGGHLDRWDPGTGAVDDGAEEVGLLGARAYAKKHEDNLLNPLIDEIGRVLSALVIVRGRFDVPGGGLDISLLAAKNVPTIHLNQNGMDYFDLHQTPDDNF